MNFRLKISTLLGLAVFTYGQVSAQTPDTTLYKTYVQPFSPESAFRTWSVGFNVGAFTTNTLFGSNNRQDFTIPKAQLGYGVYVKKQILPSFGIQADFFAGKLQADKAQPLSNLVIPYTQFDTKISWAASASAHFTLANINWKHQKSFVQPYLTAGAGLMGYTPVLHSSNGTVANFKPTNNGYIKEFFVPVGAGAKFNVASGVNIDLGYTVNFVNSDNLDGYSYGSQNDRFSFIHVGLEFIIGNREKPQLATYNPVTSMRSEYLTKEEMLENTLNAQQAQFEAQKVQYEQLKNELSITNDKLAKLTMDSDGDGVPDYFDKCPNTPPGTKVDGSGCPLPVNKPDVKIYITEDDRRVIKEAINNLEFDSGKATIREHSFGSLDKVAQLLISKNFSLKLAGHTDNVGSDDANLKLSKDRTEAIKAYLVSKGVNPSRVEATGYGKNQPIASNKTAKGRQLNRRVEFTLY